MDKSIQLSSGIDLTSLKNYLENSHPKLKTESEKLIPVWNQTLMGYKFIVGNSKDIANPFTWSNIVLNLIGGDFNPAMARVAKL